jgi:hypothetical protein
MKAPEIFLFKKDIEPRFYSIKQINEEEFIVFDGNNNYIGKVLSRDEDKMQVKTRVLNQSITLTIKLEDIEFVGYSDECFIAEK